MTRKQGTDSSWVISNVVDANIHAVRNLGVLLLGRFRAGFDGGFINWDDLAIGVHCDAVGGNLEVGDAGTAVCNSLFGLVKSLDLAALTADCLQVVEVALADGCDIAAAEDTDFEVPRLLLAILAGNFGTRALEIVQGLEDDALGTDVASDSCCVAVVGDKLVRRGQIDTVDVGMAKELLVLMNNHSVC